VSLGELKPSTKELLENVGSQIIKAPGRQSTEESWRDPVSRHGVIQHSKPEQKSFLKLVANFPGGYASHSPFCESHPCLEDTYMSSHAHKCKTCEE
jgi:predicted secreted protein